MYICSAFKVILKIGKTHIIKGTMNKRAITNVIIKKVAVIADLSISINTTVQMVSHTGHKRTFLGVCEDVPLWIGNVCVRTSFFVVEEADILMILGVSFMVESKRREEMREDGVYENIMSSDGKYCVKFRGISYKNTKNRIEKDIQRQYSKN